MSTLGTCEVCGGRVELLDNGVDRWWVHEHHPADDHDAVPLDARVAAYQSALRAARSKLAEYGWVPFGTNADNGNVRLVFSSQVDEVGDPYFERVTE